MKGKTKLIGDFKVHPIGIGTWGIGGYMEPVLGNEEKEIEAIRYSIRKGQDHIDTAEMYGKGHSEEVVGMAIEGFDRERLFIASKVHRNYTDSGDVLFSVEKILKRLNTEYLDLIYLHSYWEDENMGKYLEGINKVVKKGLARSLAVSNFNVEELKWSIAKTSYPISANQLNYNVLYKTEVTKEMVELCLKEEIAIVAYRPVERKLLADKCEDETVLKLAQKYNKTPAQIAINWLISQKNVIAIPKAVEKEHIDENIGAMDFQIEENDMVLLNNL